jgi:hypothetical protein
MVVSMDFLMDDWLVVPAVVLKVVLMADLMGEKKVVLKDD